MEWLGAGGGGGGWEWEWWCGEGERRGWRRRKVEGKGEGEVVEESYPTLHIHEQMTTSNYGYDNIMLEPNAMNNIDTVAHMNMHYTQY